MLIIFLQDCENCCIIFHFLTLGALMGLAFRILIWLWYQEAATTHQLDLTSITIG